MATGRSGVQRSQAGELAVALAVLALFGCAWLLLAPAVPGPFLFDDYTNLTNLALLSDGISPQSLGRYLHAFTGDPGRPLSALSFLIEDQAWPTDPAQFKRNNILWHLLAGVLVFALGHRLGQLRALSNQAALLLATALLAAWLLHPLHTSTLMLVVQRMTILSAIFVLAGLLIYCRILLHPNLDTRRIVAALIVLAISGGLAFLCKENGVLIFAYASAINLTVGSDTIRGLSSFARLLLHTGTAGTTLMMFVPTLLAPRALADSYAGRDFTLVERLLTQPRVLVDYLQGILLPRMSGTGVFHDDYLVSRGFLQPSSTLLAAVALFAVVTTAAVFRKRYPVPAFAILWFVAGHLIESTIFPLELYFEHRNYLPMLGPAFALAWYATRNGTSLSRTGKALFVCWLAIVSAITYHTAKTWGDELTLATAWEMDHPHSTRAIQFLAHAHVRQGDSDGARRVLIAGLREHPEMAELALQRLLLECMMGSVSPEARSGAEAAGASGRVGQVVPEIIRSLRLELASDTRCGGDLDESFLLRLIERIVANSAYSHRGDIRAFLHKEAATIHATVTKDLDQSMFHLDQVAALAPRPEVRIEQAVLLITAGLPEPALAYLDAADRIAYPGIKGRIFMEPPDTHRLRKIAEELSRQLSDSAGKSDIHDEEAHESR